MLYFSLFSSGTHSKDGSSLNPKTFEQLVQILIAKPRRLLQPVKTFTQFEEHIITANKYLKVNVTVRDRGRNIGMMNVPILQNALCN